MDQDRPQFAATCADCGQETTVPFEPKGDRPVYCRDCFSKHRDNGPSNRTRTEVTCAACGQQTTVPFEPKGDRPVYCRDCFAKQKQG